MQGQTQQAHFNNRWYQPGRNGVVRSLWHIGNSLLLMSFLPGNGWRRGLLRLFGAQIGRGVVIKPRVNVKYPWNLSIGEYSWMGEGVWIDNLGKVSIGSNCCISQGALLLCGNHNYRKVTFDLMVGDITLENGVWIGAKAMVCPGVTCHTHAVLSAGSIATTNLEAYKIYSGNPAVAVKERNIEA
ncbi:MAG: WcaF family extracellular polysaccharide biosynthesis acetyltransferase [Sphingomonadales bacterium]|jgi:putative colanic acid biosynthesis acetyltransferase WcaF